MQILHLDIPIKLLTSFLTDKTTIQPLSFDEVRNEKPPGQGLVHNKETVNISFLYLCTE